MQSASVLLAALLTLPALATIARAAEPADTRCYELRVYTAGEGKLDALNTRFRDHTCKLFEKHGMTLIGFWLPLENKEQKLYYILAYPSREAREASWKAFMDDPDWKAAFAESERGGKLAVKVESNFLHATDFSPEVKPAADGEPRVFELRTYTATPKNLPKLLARFRDHTLDLFKRHGMTNIGYWTLDAGQPGVDDTLVYLLAHKSKDARDASFKSFAADPDWEAAKAASEKDAGGSLTVKDGVKSALMSPTDYSPMK